MKRRDFLKAGSAVSIPVALNGLSFGVLPRNTLFNFIDDDTDRVLVLIQLNGGNDGLNTLIPLDQYSNLSKARQNILIPENQVLKIQEDIGFHPNMQGVKNLYDEGKVGLVQSVAYPNQNRSHFRSTDIWMSGSPASEYWTTGWLGRHFDRLYPDFPENYPNAENPDPFAITIGSIVSETCQGISSNFSMALTDPFALSPLNAGQSGELPDTNYGHELAFLLQAIAQNNAYSETVLNAAETGMNLADYAANNRLAQQLKTVALLISGGLKTKVYIVSLGGFDTHANQVDDSPSVGMHANLLEQVTGAISAFQEDLKVQNLEDRVLGMTFSEFGRQIRSNDSFGTDHGTAAPLMLFGPCVKQGILGHNPEIGDEVEPQEGVAMQYDFRSVYGTVLQDWFGVSEDIVKEQLYDNYQHLPIIEGCTSTSIFTPVKEVSEVTLYPNPCRHAATIRWSSGPGRVRISAFDHLGSEISLISDKHHAAGEKEVRWNCSSFPPGSYAIRLAGENWSQTRKLVKL